MKNSNLILVALMTACVGFGAGYFIFGRSPHPDGISSEDHAQEALQEQIWTCAMHPQIRQNEPGQCPICGMDLIPLDTYTNSGNSMTMEMTPEAAKLADIRTIAVGTHIGSPTKTIQLTGRIQMDERQVSTQVAHVPGRIEQLFVTFTGEQIRAGQKLAVIYSPELVNAQRELLEALKWENAKPQLLEAARNKLRYWKFSETMINQIERSEQVQPNITVYAEQSGVVQNRLVSTGDYVKEGSVLFDIVNLDKVWVLFDAYEEDLANIRPGDEVSFTLQAVPGRTFRTRITFIDPVINPQTRVASLRGEISNSNGLLKPEMFVKGVIEARSTVSKGVLTVPKTAVLWTGTRSVVYVEQPDATVPSYEFREVTIGQVLGDEYTVVSGLEPGERVVVTGAFVIDAAAQLNNMTSMMNRNVRRTGMSTETLDFSAEVPDEFRNMLTGVVSKYMTLKDALVSTDPALARKNGAELLSELGEVNMELVHGRAHMYWMQELEALQGHGEAIVESDDIEVQRKQFSFLSNVLKDVLTAFGTEGDTVYVQFCPMAFDNAGADWLSMDAQILNPYFGSKMLKCGSIKGTFPPEKNGTSPSDKTMPSHEH